MLLSKFLDPKNDFAFKRIFGNERNKDILIHFLNDVLIFKNNAKIKKVSFLKTIQDPEIASKKQSIVDVLCQDEEGSTYIVEMQVARTSGFEKRAQYYAAKAYINQLHVREEYAHLKEVIFLAITDFIMFPDKKEYKSDHIILDRLTYEHDLKDFSFTFLELPKFNLSLDELHTMSEKWAYFFKHADVTKEKELDQIIGNDEIIGKAYEQLNQLSWSQEEINTYEQALKSERDARAIERARQEDYEAAKIKFLQEGAKEGFEKGIEQGIEKGVNQAKIEIARRMLQEKVSRNLIIEITGLTQNDLEKITF